MSICHSGLTQRVYGKTVSIIVAQEHPLIRLANALSWETLAELVMPDLRMTAKKKWWVGRPLSLRVHLGAYVLQQLFNKTDRQTEYGIKDNAGYQLFCGKDIVKKWNCPDHTKIEEFRSRLTAETQQKLANQLTRVATQLGFAKAEQLDIDSTIQEANMSYPSDVNLLGKLTAKVKKVRDYFMTHVKPLCPELPEVDLKKVKSHIRDYFFKKPNNIQDKQSLQRKLWHTVCTEVKQTLRFCENFEEILIESKLPWNIRTAIIQIKEHGKKYLLDVSHFIRKGTIQSGKILSFHAQAVSCFNKNKLDRRLQFGRNFQLGRVFGNFFIVGRCETVRQEDKKSMQSMIKLHQEWFSGTTLESVTADKGYYSKANEKALKDAQVKKLGLQKPIRKKTNSDNGVSEKLVNRRAGIEPLIGHVKHLGQLGKSRMKSDKTTEASGYAAIMGFNGRQLMRYLMEAAVP